MKQVTLYSAEDGRLFTSKIDCLIYEDKMRYKIKLINLSNESKNRFGKLKSYGEFENDEFVKSFEDFLITVIYDRCYNHDDRWFTKNFSGTDKEAKQMIDLLRRCYQYIIETYDTDPRREKILVDVENFLQSKSTEFRKYFNKSKVVNE